MITSGLVLNCNVFKLIRYSTRFNISDLVLWVHRSVEFGRSGQITFGWQQKESTFPLMRAASKVKRAITSLDDFESHLSLSKLMNKKIEIYIC